MTARAHDPPVTLPPDERTAVLVIRAWLESQAPRLRARISQTPDLVGGEESSTVVSTPEAVTRAVTEWLEALLHRTP